MNEKAGIKITTEQASIETLEVKIKTVRVSKKQMTLAVFRQLPVKGICNKGALIDYNYWGVVRYTIKDEGKLWVVCSDQKLLFRHCIDQLYMSGVERILAKRTQQLIRFEEYCKYLEDYKIERAKYLAEKRVYDSKVEILMQDCPFQKAPEDGQNGYSWDRKIDAEIKIGEWITANIGCDKPFFGLGEPYLPDGLNAKTDYSALKQSALNQFKIYEKTNKSYQSLYDLDQLFIAV